MISTQTKPDQYKKFTLQEVSKKIRTKVSLQEVVCQLLFLTTPETVQTTLVNKQAQRAVHTTSCLFSIREQSLSLHPNK